MLRVSVLGRFDAVLDDRPVPWLHTNRHRSALLVLLAVDGPLPREQVASVFWPESSTDRSRRALNQAVYDLRRLLGDASVSVAGDRIGLAGEVWVDASEFDRLCSEKRPDEALALYRGAFLAGEHLVDSAEFESWIERREAVARRQHRLARRDQISGLVQAGRLRDALASAQAWTSIEPDEDEAHHRVLELLAATGDRAEALQHYEAYARALRGQGLEPLDETQTLVESLRAGEAGAMARPVVGLLTARPPAEAAVALPVLVAAAAPSEEPSSALWADDEPERVTLKGRRYFRGRELVVLALAIGVTGFAFGKLRPRSNPVSGALVLAGAAAASPLGTYSFSADLEAGPVIPLPCPAIP